MLSQEARESYADWLQTGILTTDEDIVKELYDTFYNISKIAIGIVQYELMWKDAVHTQNKLADITRARKRKLVQTEQGDV